MQVLSMFFLELCYKYDLLYDMDIRLTTSQFYIFVEYNLKHMIQLRN